MISEADFADLVASAATDVKKIIRVEDRLVLYVCVCVCVCVHVPIRHAL
jgi:hypothetical protein